ncbi:AlbA family DNA-binding domain-containing protein [Flavobacterium sp. 3HN19-14]|uniref:AlbA family DNA-binding domain-containing protein n=1 Tax=Flavobacterium sp. 3HN19-14 TaxID=3448133 RepID=UPI003EE28DE1
MKELFDIIEFENENTSLDFKAVQYKKEQFESFIKDIISLANAITKEDKYIIVGVKLKGNGERDILGISEEFIDEGTYQQIIINNVEPEIVFQYFPLEFKSKKLGIFQLKEISNPPYMMKKDYGKLKQGDSFIRKGSHQKKLIRSDLDKIFSNKSKENKFKGKVTFSFEEFEISAEKIIEQNEIVLPSAKAEQKIKKIISQKEFAENHKPVSMMYQMPRIYSLFGNSTYEERDLPTLRKNLENVNETYKDDDTYYLLEETAHKINFFITNDNDEYIEDASIEICIKKSDKIIVCKSICPKPEKPTSPLQPINLAGSRPSWKSINYPEVSFAMDNIKIFQEIGNIKHQISQTALKVPFRLVLTKNCKQDVLDLEIKLYGKNLPEPISEYLKLKII